MFTFARHETGIYIFFKTKTTPTQNVLYATVSNCCFVRGHLDKATRYCLSLPRISHSSLNKIKSVIRVAGTVNKCKY